MNLPAGRARRCVYLPDAPPAERSEAPGRGRKTDRATRGEAAIRLAPLYLLLALLLCAPLAAAPAGPFTFCYGLERGGPPGLPRELGLNTLYVDLLPSDMGDLEPARKLIRSAHDNGLKVIVGLPTCLTAKYRVSPYDADYTGSVCELIGYFVGKLKGEPGVTAWGTGHALEKALNYSDGDFEAYLREGYPSLEALNASWGTRFVAWGEVTQAAAREADAKAAFKVGRASVDLADYNRRAYHDTMALWLAAIRRTDPQRPVLTGRVTLYRSLAAIPDGYDIVCTSFPPDVVEGDLLTHNVQGVDLARRAGKFDVLQILRVPSNASPAYADNSMRAWIQQAALHGACGFGLEDWGLLSQMYAIESRQAPKARRLCNAIATGRSLSFDFRPRPAAAVVISPYAEGLQVTGQPLYGYMRDYLRGEPANLAYLLRLGTRYGLVDYLTVEDLLRADLRQYGALLLPACLRLSRPAQLLLDEYVNSGGALVADLGLGMYETGSWLQLPELLQQTLGVTGLHDMKERTGDLSAALVSVPGLPALPQGGKSSGVFSPGGGDTGPATQHRLYTFCGPTAEATLAEGTVPVATASVRFDSSKRPIFSGLFGRREGSGLTVFASHPLWQYWLLSDPLSAALHDPLFARRATWRLAEGGFLPGNPFLAVGADGVALLNLQRDALTTQLWAYGAASHPFTGAVSCFSATPLQQGFPAGTALVVAALPGETLTRLGRSPLLVQPYAEDVTVALDRYGPGQISFRISGAGATLAGSPGRGLELHNGSPVQVRLLIASGAYPIAPRSRHLVTTRTRGGRDVKEVVTAGDRGELDLSDTYRQETLTITPAS